MKSIDNFAKKVDEARSEFKLSFSNDLQEFSKEFFESHKGAESFGWVQYTPYFMDGDPCVFSVAHGLLNGDYCDGSSWYDGEEFDGYEAAAKDVGALVSKLQDCEDALHAIFGDHCAITATREGIETSRYDHD